jgi:hypothetical protein
VANLPDEQKMLEELRDLGQRGLGERSALWALSEINRLNTKLATIANLLDEGAYGMATDEARGS